MLKKKDSLAIRLDAVDNVAVACSNFQKNDTVVVQEQKIILLDDVAMAHKIAVVDIQKNENVVKFGVSIGYAIKDIKKGELVHLHNMKSNYIVIE